MHADAVADHGVRGASIYTLSDTASDTQSAALARRENDADRFAGAGFRDQPPEVARILASLVRQETRAGSARMQRTMVAALDRDLPMLQNPARHAAFAVLKAADIPSILVEMGFMSNPQDEAALRRAEHRAKVATAMKRAVDGFLRRPGDPRGRIGARDEGLDSVIMDETTPRERMLPPEPAPKPGRAARTPPRHPPPLAAALDRPPRSASRSRWRPSSASSAARSAYHEYQRITAELPTVDGLLRYQPPVMSRIYAGDDRLIAELAKERRIFIPYNAIPDVVKQAFVSAEDQNFWTHKGVDPGAIARAAFTDLIQIGKNRRPIGASTITQQVARNMLLGSNERSLDRKVKEAVLAIRIEATLSKERILELYLNEIYFGLQSYGVAAAAQTYFDKSLDQLTLPEAAFLASLPKAPNNYNPFRFPDAARNRRDWVLDRLVDDKAVTAEQAAAAKAGPVVTGSSTGRRWSPGPSGSARRCAARWWTASVRTPPRRAGWWCAPASTPRCRRWRTRCCAAA